MSCHIDGAATAPSSKFFSSCPSLLRLPQVLARIPISRSGWYAGIKAGKYPQPVKLGPRTAAWRESDIDQLIQSLTH